MMTLFRRAVLPLGLAAALSALLVAALPASAMAGQRSYAATHGAAPFVTQHLIPGSDLDLAQVDLTLPTAKVVALTIDDGPDGHDPHILDILRAHGAKATFFYIGAKIPEHHEIAKLVAAQLGNDQSLSGYVGIGLLKTRKRKLVCIPATSGTGSEVSPNAILVDDGDDQKKGIISPFLVPDIVYIDPLLTVSVPPDITAATGLDALTHCLEAYTNLHAQPFIDLYAFEGMRLIAAYLVRAVRNGNDEEARSQVAMGSLLGGFCLGPVNTAAVHALSYPLGSSFHLPHGLSNALLLPYVMAFNLPAAPERYAGVARALGCDTAEQGVDKIRELIRQCGLPATLKEVGVPYEAIGTMAADAMKITRLLKNNPRPVTLEDAITIYKSAYE